ncbi:hypothetical protein [Clostridium perfringens]|uniref:hypothetical protein n=1 Tax=Clostridium perfringens TaxID=1502 RepID=UPI002149489E|nr:hypothetical protein [Clostridium perfringens]ELC8423332.1 hypothetical protein [Clostridium perfringens]MDV5113451.1 hypothetical protein [Clostridium perfringens]UUR88417.1 hypothetical protein NQ194_15995 [Clostridium perfringens]
MIKLLKYNLKKQKIKNVIIIIFIGIIMPLMFKDMIINHSTNNITLKNIFIEIFGGISSVEDISIMKLIIFLTPHLIIIALLEIYFIDLIDNTPRNMFLRIKSLKCWSLSLNISLLYTIIRYYLILYCTSIITILVYLPKKNLNEIVSFITLNDIILILQIMVLSIMTIYLIILIANNIYFICNKEERAIIIVILINITTILFSKLGEKINMLFIMNHMILKRYSIFQGGYSYLTFKYSIIYIGLFIVLNLILNIVLVKKQDY